MRENVDKYDALSFINDLVYTLKYRDRLDIIFSKIIAAGYILLI